MRITRILCKQPPNHQHPKTHLAISFQQMKIFRKDHLLLRQYSYNLHYSLPSLSPVDDNMYTYFTSDSPEKIEFLLNVENYFHLAMLHTKNL